MGSLLASVPHHTTQTGTGLPPGPLAEDGLVKGLSRRSAFCLPPCDPDRSLPTSSECENKPEVARASWKEDYKKPRQCHDFPLRHSVGPHPRFSPPGSRRYNLKGTRGRGQAAPRDTSLPQICPTRGRGPRCVAGTARTARGLVSRPTAPLCRLFHPSLHRASFSLFWASGGCLRSRLGSAQSSPEREQRDPRWD